MQSSTELVQAKPKVETRAGLEPDLYHGWMVGFSFRASRDLYFGRANSTDAEEAPKSRLQPWLYTCLNLVDLLTPSDQHQLDAMFKSMIEDTEQRRRRSVSREKFDQQYSSILGALRAKMPFAYNAAQFAYGTSGLTHQPTIDETLILLNDLEGLLTNLGNGIAKETQELIRYDIQTLSRMILEQKLTFDQLKPKLKNLRRLWPDLILGQIPIKQVLNRRDDVELWLVSSAVGVLLFSGVAAIVVAPFAILFAILTGLGFVSASALTFNATKDLVTLFGSLLTLITGIGVSFSFFYRKASEWLKGFVSFFAVRLAKGRSLS